MERTSTLKGFSLLIAILASCFTGSLQAQIDPTLSVQGILKKANGVAVDDGTYSITFKLYTQPTGGAALWTEAQSSVEVSSGIYSATLGTITPLNVAFDQLYYLGVTVGSTELTPRVLLTSAPYALSLIGQTNKFPSSGGVRADSVRVATNLVVNGNFPTTHSIVAVGGYLARGGAPGLNGANNNGYAFDGNSGDKDSGLFGTADGRVSLYSNNTEVLAVTPGAATVAGTVSANDVAVISNGTVSYNGLDDWRLVEVDYLESDNEGWAAYGPTSGGANGWNLTTSSAATVVDFGNFAGKALRPSQNYTVFKKSFAPPGSYTYVKVKFKYFLLDTWGFGPGDQGWAAFAASNNGNAIRVGWSIVPSMVQAAQNMGGNYITESNFANTTNGLGENNGDSWVTGEMIGRYSSVNGAFWVYFGSGLDEGAPNENFAVGMIEIWVK